MLAVKLGEMLFGQGFNQLNAFTKRFGTPCKICPKMVVWSNQIVCMFGLQDKKTHLYCLPKQKAVQNFLLSLIGVAYFLMS